MTDHRVVLGDPKGEPPASAVGQKARTLHVLRVSGLPVPEAIAFSWHLAARIGSGDDAARSQAAEAAVELGYPLAVRSSANIEDLENAAAPGLFESVLDVQDENELMSAIEQVLNSGRTRLVSDYLIAQGIAEPPHIALILQRQVRCTHGKGVLYTRPPGQPGATVAILELPGQHPVWIDRETSRLHLPEGFSLSQEQGATLWRLACQAEDALGSKEGLDIEWVWDEEGPWLVQARPIVHRRELQTWDHPDIRALIAFSRGDQARIWRLDATHNPFPLSPAQAGLVAQVRDLAPYDMRVVGGYLYTASSNTGLDDTFMEREELYRLFHQELWPKMNSALLAVEAPTPPTLPDAVDAYRKVFHCYTKELAPAIAASRSSDGDAGGNPLTGWLKRARRGLITVDALMEAVAPIAPAWDVSVPSYGETPALVKRALALTPMPGEEETEFEESLSESDDLLFYRAQHAVRRALLKLAQDWGVGEDIFFMPLDSVLKASTQPRPPADLVRDAEQARSQLEAQRALEMPLAFANGEPLPARLPPGGAIWCGFGTGGYAQGKVVRVSRLGEFPEISSDEPIVLVMPTVSPAHALAARGAVAVVCEYGEYLGHGAAMARELDIPCVVGCRRAWRELQSGDQVAVHGQAGLVARMAKKPLE